ncbi:hypothetical protein GN958_ATG18490 [Phytophthora infestans]|uniref:Uncharacterized protein n=1 Tax=Phytophthora infestans TaxID=4787 RepID=A0A8S9TWG1_PHYIN|nr:hypothetical protein GN958_ATG18490 [Phytophthora infestans]
MQSPAVTQTRAAAIQADVATTQPDTATTQAPATTTVCTDEAPTPTTPSPPTPTIRKAKGKRPARRSLICSASPMAITPPRSIRAIVQPLIATSPHVQDRDTTSPYDDTQIPDNESVKSAYFPSEPEQDDDCENAEMVARGNELLADTTDDLNVVKDSEANVIYGAIESEDAAEKDDV